MQPIFHRVNTFLLVMLVLMTGAIIAILADRAGAGPLDPPAPPSGTMHNLIFQPASCAGFPIVISQPGAYQLGGDITGCAGKDGIELATSYVTLDLAGHAVSGGGTASGSLAGIKNTGANGQLSISNGHVQQWGGSGIDLTGSSVAQVDHVVATYNGGFGIIIDSTSAVTNSTASANGANGGGFDSGIEAFGSDNRITTCQTDYNTGRGIVLNGAGNLVEDCEISSNTGYGITGVDVERVVRNHIHHNQSTGVSLGNSAEIDDNGVQWNNYGGVSCGNNCSISSNSISSNSSVGIYVQGGVGVIEDNRIFGNGQQGILVLGTAAGYPNVILRNVSTGNAGGNYALDLPYNDAGPQSTAAGATSPSTNVDQ